MTDRIVYIHGVASGVALPAKGGGWRWDDVLFRSDERFRTVEALKRHVARKANVPFDAVEIKRRPY
jgi:hypothetical protein